MRYPVQLDMTRVQGCHDDMRYPVQVDMTRVQGCHDDMRYPDEPGMMRMNSAWRGCKVEVYGGQVWVQIKKRVRRKSDSFGTR